MLFKLALCDRTPSKVSFIICPQQGLRNQVIFWRLIVSTAFSNVAGCARNLIWTREDYVKLCWDWKQVVTVTFFNDGKEQYSILYLALLFWCFILLKMGRVQQTIRLPTVKNSRQLFILKSRRYNLMFE